MTGLLWSVDYGSGSIEFIEDELTLDDPIDQQIDILREDLLQVHYNNGHYTLDVGWYPPFERAGEFRVVVVKDYDWEAPLFRS